MLEFKVLFYIFFYSFINKMTINLGLKSNTVREREKE